MKLKLKLCSDPKHLAWVSWTLLANNPVNLTMYLAFCLADLVIIMVYSFNLVQRVHFSNFDYQTITDNSTYDSNTNQQMFNLTSAIYEADKSYNSGGIKLTFLRQIDYQLNGLTREIPELLFIATIAILGFTLITLTIIGVMAISIKNHSNLEKQHILKKSFCFILVTVMTFLHMPLFDVIVRTYIAAYLDESNLTMQIIRYAICSTAIIFFSILMIFLVRIFNVCVPTELVPWCSPISKLAFLNLIIKGAMVICNAFDISGSLALIQVLIFFVLQGFQACYRILFAPNYIKEVDLFVKTKDFAVCLIFFLGIICKALTDKTNYDLVYFILFIPAVTAGWILFEQFRKETILQKIKTKTLKLEIENEFALYVMMTLVRDCLTETVASQKVFGQLMDLMLTHIEDCDDQLCICDEMENFYELLRLRQLHNQEVFPLLRQERRRFKKIIDDQGLVGTVSNMTDTTLKQNSTESTMSKTNDNNNNNEGNNLDRHAEEEDRRDEEHEQMEKEGKIVDVKKLTTEQQVARKKRNSTVYKINIDETKHRFLSELLYLFYFEMIQKFPDSFKIQLLSNYFALLYKKKEMLCVFQMRSFNTLKLSKIDQCCHMINEQYLLGEIAKIQKASMHTSQNQQDGNFNGDYFIQMNQLYKDFNISIEALSSSVVNFWKIFERQSIDVDTTLKCGTSIASNIQNVFKVFNDLDSLKIYKDYQMYFQFAIVQLHILNDPVAYELYISKMRSILEINRIYQKNFSQNSSNNSDQSNFIIVDANGARFGQIIQVNNGLRLLLGWTDEEVKRFRIENFMPQLIREKHGEFMNRYNKTGQSYLINNKATMFIKKNNGYVVPVELYIKFHYSIDYQYTFLAIMRPFYEMAPFTNRVKYNINQLIFLIVDNEEDGRITEYSESCAKLLSQYGFSAVFESNQIIKRIGDVIQGFNFQDIRNSRQERYETNEIYEDIHKIDLNQFSDSNSLQTEYAKKTGGLLASLLINNGGIMNAKTRIFEERYSGGVLDLNVFCFAFINDGEGSTIINGSSVPSKTRSQLHSHQDARNDANLVKNGGADEGSVHTDEKMLEDSLEKENESHSATASSTSSMRDSTTSMAEFRNFHSFTEQATPRSLTTILKLIVALYLIMVIIAAANLGVNISRQIQSELDVHTVREAFDRMNWVSMNQLLVRVLVNIANGYEPENSVLVNDRYNEYVKLQEIRVQQLKDTQSLLQQSTFAVSDDFEQFQSGKNVPLYYLSESNIPYVKYESLNVAFNIYIAKLTEMNGFHKRELIGNLSIQTLNFNTSTSYRPSYYEQSLYFIIQNGNKELRQFAIDSCYFYARESEFHAEQNIVSTKILAIISVIIIVIIGLIIAPIMTTAEIRKYKALLYFLKIPRDKLPDLIKNCEYCLNMNEEGRYLQIQKDYESFLGIKLVDQQVEQLRQARDEAMNIENQTSGAGDSSGARSSALFSSEHMDRDSATTRSKISNNNRNGNGDEESVAAQILGSDIQSAVGSINSGTKMESINQTRKKNSDQIAKKKSTSNLKNDVIQEEVERENDMLDHNNERDQDEGIDQKEATENQNAFNLANLNLKQNRKKEKKNVHEEAKTQEEQDFEDSENHEFAKKAQLINARAYKRRSVIIFSSLSVILLLSTYFIIAYFLAMKTFETAAEVIGSLESIFYKGSCFDSVMNFLRESEIRNQSMMTKSAKNSQLNFDDKTEYVATEYYLDFCYSKEDDYNRMRVQIPKFFENAAYYINEIESINMCEHIYTGEFHYLVDICKTSLNGILNKGLTNAFYYMFTQILKQNIYFIGMGATSKRNATVLKEMMLDEQIVQIIDMKAQVLDPALNQLKQICMESVINYIQKLLNDFITAFIVFTSLLSAAILVLIFVGFRILRRSMWNTNIILKVIPFETLPRQDRIDIKDFFNS